MFTALGSTRAKTFTSKRLKSIITYSGEVAEWLNVPDSKSGVPQGIEGSNPSLSAILKDFSVYLENRAKTNPKMKLFQHCRCNFVFEYILYDLPGLLLNMKGKDIGHNKNKHIKIPY